MGFFASTMKLMGFTVPLTQNTRQVLTRKEFCVSSDSVNLSIYYLIISKHISTFIWFADCTNQLKVFLSVYSWLLHPLECRRLIVGVFY